MNTKRLSTNKIAALSVLCVVIIGLMGCGTLGTGAVEAKAADPNPTQTETVEMEPIEIEMEPERYPVDLPSAAPSPSEAEAAPLLSDEDAIQAALAAHFEMDESEFTRFEVEENTGMHAKGSVAAGGEGGGYFLVAKVDGQWLFVSGGHSIDCDAVAPYGFPAAMVPWCEQPEDETSPSSEAEYPTVRITGIRVDQSVTIEGVDFPPNDTVNVLLNYNGTLGIDGILVATFETDASGELIATCEIPELLRGQSVIAIRLESPASGYYAYSWFYNL